MSCCKRQEFSQYARTRESLKTLRDGDNLRIIQIDFAKVNLVVLGPSMICYIGAFSVHFHVYGVKYQSTYSGVSKCMLTVFICVCSSSRSWHTSRLPEYAAQWRGTFSS